MQLRKEETTSRWARKVVICVDRLSPVSTFMRFASWLEYQRLLFLLSGAAF